MTATGSNADGAAPETTAQGGKRLLPDDLPRIRPHIARSTILDTAIAALTGDGAMLAAKMGSTLGLARYKGLRLEARQFGQGVPERCARQSYAATDGDPLFFSPIRLRSSLWRRRRLASDNLPAEEAPYLYDDLPTFFDLFGSSTR